MSTAGDILMKRFEKLEKHYLAIREYKALIDSMVEKKNIFDPKIFADLITEERAVLDAYLKRFSSIQDFLGAKLFPLLLEVGGIGSERMSETLERIEKEGIIDSLGSWIEMREVRNDLEHDYPESLAEALVDLRFCIDNFWRLESYFINSKKFAERYLR